MEFTSGHAEVISDFSKVLCLHFKQFLQRCQFACSPCCRLGEGVFG